MQLGESQTRYIYIYFPCYVFPRNPIMDANEHGNYIECANANYCQNNNLISFRRVPSINRHNLLCLHYIIAPIFIGTLKLVPLILSFVSQSNLFILINVLGIKNYILNKAEGEFESVSFDITTSLSTQKICFTTASSHNPK